MNRRQYLHTLSLGLVAGAGCVLPSPSPEERIDGGSVEFDNRTSERATLELRGWRLDRGRTPTETVSEEPEVSLSLTAPAESTVLEPAVFPTWTWRIRASAGGYETTVEYEIVHPAFVTVSLDSDGVLVTLAGNNG